jgi:quercetin dioxygenase-like cupin family protein
MPDPFVTTPATAPRPLNVVGEKITVLASADQTGCYEVFLQDGPAGTGPPPHSHGWDESFYVLSGEVEFSMGDSAQVAAPGTLVHVPAGAVHWFRFGAGGGLMLSVTSRAGASEVFAAIDREIPPGPPDIAKLLNVVAGYGVTAALPAGA